MTAIFFVGIYFLGKGINLQYIKKNNLEKGQSYIVAGITIIIVSLLDKYGFFSKLAESFSNVF